MWALREVCVQFETVTPPQDGYGIGHGLSNAEPLSTLHRPSEDKDPDSEDVIGGM